MSVPSMEQQETMATVAEVSVKIVNGLLSLRGKGKECLKEFI